MKQTLAAGVQVAVAPCLFPTPPWLASRMVAVARLGAVRKRVLEPSAGTGRLALAAVDAGHYVLAVEINHSLANALRARRERSDLEVVTGDFLEQHGDLGTAGFDAVIMNPPFDKGSDIRHIEHARSFLKPGGRLVAICAGGPRQEERLRPLAKHWEPLPPETFSASGTNVNTVLLVIEG
jgi:16S rRNA G1207 methylase RsmC